MNTATKFLSLRKYQRDFCALSLLGVKVGWQMPEFTFKCADKEQQWCLELAPVSGCPTEFMQKSQLSPPSEISYFPQARNTQAMGWGWGRGNMPKTQLLQSSLPPAHPPSASPGCCAAPMTLNTVLPLYFTPPQLPTLCSLRPIQDRPSTPKPSAQLTSCVLSVVSPSGHVHRYPGYSSSIVPVVGAA